MTPLAEDGFGLQVTINRKTYELLQQARSLLSHQIPRGEMALVLERALELAVAELESASTPRSATVEDTRLLCAAPNQHKAERDFGTEFMERKRAKAKRNRRALRRDPAT